MTWSVIPIPAAEELSFGYAPAPIASQASRAGEAKTHAFRAQAPLVIVFVCLALLTAVQNALSANPADGQRRLAEVNLVERKGECRGCNPEPSASDDPLL